MLGTLTRLGLERLLDRKPSRQRALVVAMIAARILEPRSKQQRIDEDAALDGLYVIHTNFPKDDLTAGEAVRSYKSFSRVERALRSLKSVDLKVRPVHHRLADRVRAHVFLRTLAYYVEWHMRRRLAPILFDDEHNTDDSASPVKPARKSNHAKLKANSRRTDDELPVHSYQTPRRA